LWIPVACASGVAAKISRNAMNIIPNGLLALLLGSIFSSLVTLGNLDTQKNKATARNNACEDNIQVFTDAILTSAAGIFADAEPNSTKPTITGPKMLPKLFTPPAKFKRWVPVSGLPKRYHKRVGCGLL
jgi:hypothetical protein